MFRKITAGLLSFSLVVVAPQIHAASKLDKNGQNSMPSARQHLSHIVFAGLAGAILGLSTLSFYGRPQDRLSNIAVGFAIGIIAGTAFTTYKAAAEPKEFYGLRDPSEAQLWALENSQMRSATAEVPRAGLKFTF